MKASDRGSVSSSRIRRGLTVFQTALSVLLLIGAGLFVQSLIRVSSLDLGIDPDGVLFVEPVFHPGVSDFDRAEFFRRARERLAALPIVEGSSTDLSIPYRQAHVTLIRGGALDAIQPAEMRFADIPFTHLVSPGYFDLLGLRIEQGRGLLAEDRAGTGPVVVINRTLARRAWAEQDPIGQCMYIGNPQSDPRCLTVVGVVENARRSRLNEDETMEYYLAAGQSVIDLPPRALLLRVGGDPDEALDPIRRELLALEPRLRFAEIRDLSTLLEPETRTWSLGATMFSLFGALALIVAALGVYSLLAFSVAQRTFEIGVRSALGATRVKILRMVVGEGARLTIFGIVVGGTVALLTAPLLESLLYDTTARDALSFSAAAAILALTGILASVGPAVRATRIDPARALRDD
ncbi:MAG: FtsX-like permease family protein [Gemmatimonas sp.]|nr:FtsX-like permease family protein [Gemmatimonas sp.]